MLKWVDIHKDYWTMSSLCDKMARYSHMVYCWCALKKFSVKIGSISFVLSSDMQKFHYLLGCHTTGINSDLISLLSAFCFLNFLRQAKSLTWIIVSGSSSSKLLIRSISYCKRWLFDFMFTHLYIFMVIRNEF